MSFLNMGTAIRDTGIALAASDAESMRIFAGEDGFFCLGEWRAWRDACIQAGKTLPPDDFKKGTET